MRILVSGGAGFIGSHLCERLAKEHDVVCIDNLITGEKRNLEGIKVEFVEHDVTEALPKEITASKFDVIFNLASPASPIDYANYPIETLLVGSIGTRNMLELAVKNKARILHTSTSEVYGDPLEHPQKESYWGNVNSMGPRSCYDESKRFAEALCMAYFRKKKANVVMSRIFNTYGPKMRANDGRVIPNFIAQSLEGKPLTIYGSGKQTRSFCYVSDMTDALIKLAFSKFTGEVFNVGNPRERTMLELAEIVGKTCGVKAKIEFKELPVDDPLKRKPDITKIKKALGWEPKIEIEEGLKSTVDYFRKLK
ncbi:MAG: UDP-glucuronic acid decarboxylase family protein [Candidatus Micrarchaeota archaeon]